MDPRPSPHQSRFLDLALRCDALRFGDFLLKSGRESPYFFNAGQFNSGAALAGLAECYAEAVLARGLGFDMLFGPAYKGIPLATALAVALAARGRDLPVAFNRKEAKAHGEGGHLIGAPLSGRVLIVDDVITAGTAIRESAALIRAAGAIPAGVLVALDRQERGAQGERSAAREVEAALGLPVVAVATLDDLLAYAGDRPDLALHHGRLLAYRAAYGSRED
ncbi:MAG: orotate phosphoribosyltransferase [Xanthomonadaceae bacterium]|jgi:orotate phosphoribosyltransferase|nr:orotate phosphoribosyltransferase [Xanthomonadaceae bacterium]